MFTSSKKAAITDGKISRRTLVLAVIVMNKKRVGAEVKAYRLRPPLPIINLFRH